MNFIGPGPVLLCNAQRPRQPQRLFDGLSQFSQPSAAFDGRRAVTGNAQRSPPGGKA